MIKNNVILISNFLRNLTAAIRQKINKIILIIGILISINSIIFSAFSDAPTPSTPSSGDEILNILKGLTCQTAGIGDLLRTEFAHTCQSSSVVGLVLANIVAPLEYADFMLRLRIHDDTYDGSVFSLKDNCARDHRADPDNPTITFAICNNMLLEGARALAVADAVIAIAEAMVTGDDPWPGIKKAFDIPKHAYHHEFPDQVVGKSGWDFDTIGSFLVLPWKVQQIKDRICVSTMTLLGIWIPVGCKYINEPFPKSIYASFMDPPLPTISSQQVSNLHQDDPYDPRKLTTCTGIDNGGCYQRVYNASKTGLIITSPLIECIQQMLAKLMISEDVCSMADIDKVMTTNQRETSSFFQFRVNMQRLVAAVISLYVMFFGISMFTNPGNVSKKEIVNFCFKILFVTFFAIGIQIRSMGASVDKVDGVTSIVLPFLLSALNEIAGWIINASPGELCKFNAAEYPDSLRYLALWDSIDCRLSHYLGLDMLATMFVENLSRKHDFLKFDVFNFAIPPYFYLAVPAVITGETTLIELTLMYPILVITIVAYLVNSTVVCMIGIVILLFIAPLMVPMYLFNYTRGYFDNWVRLVISYTLQPMIVVTFIITLFTVYDYGFYGSCKYLSKDLTLDSKVSRYFYIDNNWDDYNLQEKESCKNSLGYMLNNPQSAQYDMVADTVEGVIGKIDNDVNNSKKKFDFLDGMVSVPGIFINGTKIILEKIRKLVLSLFIACFTLYLMNKFSEQISEFAADLSLGVSLSSVTLNPKATFDAIMSGIGGAASKGAGGLKSLDGMMPDKPEISRNNPSDVKPSNSGSGETSQGKSIDSEKKTGIAQSQEGKSEDPATIQESKNNEKSSNIQRVISSGLKSEDKKEDLSESKKTSESGKSDENKEKNENKHPLVGTNNENNSTNLKAKISGLENRGDIGNNTSSLSADNNSVTIPKELDNIEFRVSRGMMGPDNVNASREGAEQTYRNYIEKFLTNEDNKGREKEVLDLIAERAPDNSKQLTKEINNELYEKHIVNKARGTRDES